MTDKAAMIKVHACGTEKTFPAGTTFAEIVSQFQNASDLPALIVKENNCRYRELSDNAFEDCSLELITYLDKNGRDTYRRSLCLLMQKAFDAVLQDPDVHVWIRFTVSQGLFCTLEGGNVKLTQELLDQVKKVMEKYRDEAFPIEKKSVKTEKAAKIFKKAGMIDKSRLFHYRIASRTNIYTLDGYQDYNYGDMVQNCSVLKMFDLVLYEDGFVLMMPDIEDPSRMAAFAPVKKLFHVQNRSRKWGTARGIDTVGDLNDVIASGDSNLMVLVQEALQEKMIADIAEQIAERKDVRVVLIAGPSSSGKTTFSYRLSIQLACHGLNPYPIAMDNYFKNRDDTPKHPDGSYDFECLEALDVEQFNQDISDLLAGREVNLPSFNFKTGEREYKGNKMKLNQNDILVIEGIHGLNEKMSYQIPHESKFKVYISALTMLNIDEHNRIPTTDGRLLRRIVRDDRTRGAKAQDTIRMWKSVRNGEEKYIFPYQESADAMFNSALIYELAVLKTFAQPVLFGVPKDSPEWPEAKRLLKFLDYFLPVPTEDIPKNSLVREFVGGGCFNI